jgi:type II secretory pathway component PulF
MSLLILPRHFSQRAELYQQFARLTTAGIGIPQAVEIQLRSPPDRSFRGPLETVLRELAGGATFHESLLATGKWFPAFDAALLHAGEHSGRLPACFELLAAHYERNARLLQRTYSSLIYPAVLFHLAVIVTPLPNLFLTGDIMPFLATTLVVLAPAYAIVGFIVLAMQGRHGEVWQSTIERVLGRVPVLGKARRNLALARLASSLEALISAGVNIIEAWELAASACGSPALKRTILSWQPDLLAGLTPAELVSSSGVFPELFANLYRTGEVTGSLDDALRKLHQLYQSDAERQFQAVADWTPRLIYFGVVILVGYKVISFWSGYFNQISDVLGK